MTEVIKRDGTLQSFDKQKIVDSINKAFIETRHVLDEDTSKLSASIADGISTKTKTLSVEDIQDIIVYKLMASKYKDVAEAYTNYRYLHELARTQYKDLMSAIWDKIGAANVENQNANVDEKSFGGRAGEVNRLVLKKLALDYCMPLKHKENHVNNEIYIHDLDSFALGMHNCLSIPFDDLLSNGFNTRQTDVRPAQSLSTAFQLVAVIFQLQSLQQFGGVSATHLDWTMVPYVRKSFHKHWLDGMKYIAGIKDYEDSAEYKYCFANKKIKDISIDDAVYQVHSSVYQYAFDMTEREARQSVEGMYHNLNTLQSRSGNQLN